MAAAGAAFFALAALAGTAANAKKGGALRVEFNSAVGFSDPALAYGQIAWQIEYATALKLVNYPDRPGDRGRRLVPEAAARFPTVSRDGRTYTFTLKKRFRFSNGRPVTAANFLHAFRRIGALPSSAKRYLGDLRSVQASGRYKLRFNLARPAGDFLSRLAMPYFSAVPTNLPRRPVRGALVTAGPYYVASNRGSRMVLARNRFYPGPRPNNPARVEIDFNIPDASLVPRVESGQADVTSVPGSQAAGLRERYGVNRGRFFVKGQAVFWYVNFNHDQPLFKNNAALGRAVNHAIDRPAMVREHGALGGARTDQILPVDFPGFRNWNLYSLKGSNIAKANREAEGHRRSGHVRFWTFNSAFGPGVAQVVQFNLKQIGLDTDITTFPSYGAMVQAESKRGAPFDASIVGWSADYPDPYDFLNVLLNGNSIHADNNVNLSYFNESNWNQRMDQANHQFGAARLRSYSILDRDLMTQGAPIAPYINTNARILVSSRVRNYVFHKVYGTDFAAISLLEGPPSTGVTISTSATYRHPKPNPGYSWLCGGLDGTAGAFVSVSVSGPRGYTANKSVTLSTGHATVPFQIFSYGDYHVAATATKNGKTATDAADVNVTSAPGTGSCGD